MRPALFLDRDGVINEDCDYCHRVDQFVWIPGVFDTVRTANQLGFATIVVTNQAGIARGFYTEADFLRLTDWMTERFRAEGAPLAGVYFCPYHVDGLPPYDVASPFRKPGPGMLLQAAREHELDLARSALLGDQESDIQAGIAAGLQHTALLSRDPTIDTAATAVVRDHAQAQAWLGRCARDLATLDKESG